MLIDPAVVVKARAGDAAAFNQIVQACRKPILGTIRRLIGNADDVEDVAQEVFVRVYYSLDQLRSEDGFEAWLYRLTVNSAYDYLRRKKRRQESRMYSWTPKTSEITTTTGKRPLASGRAV